MRRSGKEKEWLFVVLRLSPLWCFTIAFKFPILGSHVKILKSWNFGLGLKTTPPASMFSYLERTAVGNNIWKVANIIYSLISNYIHILHPVKHIKNFKPIKDNQIHKEFLRFSIRIYLIFSYLYNYFILTIYFFPYLWIVGRVL